MACMKLLAFALLLMSNLNSFQFTAQGRQFTKLSKRITQTRSERENGVKMIGSRPPRCDKMCKSCGHCKAVQVPIPILPSVKYPQPLPITAVAYSRGDDISNYKPMCWKCKCGDFIFNP